MKVYWWCFHGHGAVHRELKRKRDILYVHLLYIMMYSYYSLSAVLADNVVGTESAGHWFISVFFHCMSTLTLKPLRLCLPHSIKINTYICFVSMLFAIIAETFEVVFKTHHSLNLHFHIKLCESILSCRLKLSDRFWSWKMLSLWTVYRNTARSQEAFQCLLILQNILLRFCLVFW